jgi:hypothetical protein
MAMHTTAMIAMQATNRHIWAVTSTVEEGRHRKLSPES